MLCVSFWKNDFPKTRLLKHRNTILRKRLNQIQPFFCASFPLPNPSCFFLRICQQQGVHVGWEDEAIHGNIQSSRFACNGPSFRQKAGFSEFEIFLAKGDHLPASARQKRSVIKPDPTFFN